MTSHTTLNLVPILNVSVECTWCASAVVDEHAAPYQQVDPVWPQWDGARLIAGPLARAAPALWHRGRGCRIYRQIVDNVNNLSTKKEEKRDICTFTS